MRRNANGALQGEASSDMAAMKDGRLVPGLSIRYSDRVILVIDPVDDLLPVGELLAQESSMNTRGETHHYYRTEVRGVPAVARDQGVQKWDANGDDGEYFVNEYPSLIEWVEADESGQLISYTLVADLPVEALRGMAGSLTPASQTGSLW